MQHSCRASIKDAISSTPEFKKLYQVSFLGIINYACTNKSRTHTDIDRTRAGHTLNVFDLTAIAADGASLTEGERNIAGFAAMCHDLGHLVFSHTAEKVLNRDGNIFDHKDETISIIESRDGSILSLIEYYGLPLNRIQSLITGEKSDILYWILNGPINIDTIDGITRFLSIANIEAPYSSESISYNIGKLSKGAQLNDSEIDEIDRFWLVKKGFYEQFLVHGYFADYEHTFVGFMQNELGSAIDKLRSVTEKQIIEETGWDAQVFRQIRSKPRDRKPRWNFSIDNNVKLNSIDDLKRRYTRRNST